jgi:hypothetical protein
METQKYRGLFNPGGCLNSQTFKRYLENSLRPAEKARVEDHLRHCLICSEALEGYKRHRRSGIMQSDLDFLSLRIKKRYSARQSKKYTMPVSILVSLFVFLIILMIIFYIIRFLLIQT